MFLPNDVKEIIGKLKSHGFEAYAVGGCVRDSILGRDPKDWDITTSATPEETKSLFDRTFDTGIEHGTVTVLQNKIGYEVTTYRVDGKYEDGRHPTEVAFTRSLEEDLLRRDFTINAMAYNEEDGLVDIFGGLEDLEKGIIRCVGDAKQRFGEDALRILRAVRFSAQLGFSIEEETEKGAAELAPTLKKISAERIQVEMIKLLVSNHPGYMEKAYELGITKEIMPQWDQAMKDGIGQHTLRALKYIRPIKELRLAILLLHLEWDGSEKVASELLAKKIMRDWKLDNATIQTVCKVIACWNFGVAPEEKAIRMSMYRMGKDTIPQYIEVQKAELLAKPKADQEKGLQILDSVEALHKEIIEQGQCTQMKELEISGRDLIAMGMKPGEQMGALLRELLLQVIEQPELNTKEHLLANAIAFFSSENN